MVTTVLDSAVPELTHMQWEDIYIEYIRVRYNGKLESDNRKMDFKIVWYLCNVISTVKMNEQELHVLIGINHKAMLKEKAGCRYMCKTANKTSYKV